MNSRRISTLAACATAAILWVSACDGGTEPPPPDPPRPTTVTVTPSAAELAALEATVQLTAEVRDQYGNVMAGASVSWASSEAAVAAVDAAGLVTAAANGAATITATSGQASGTAAVTVAQVVAAVAVTPEADTLVEADTLRLSAEAADANGHAVEAAEFAWSSGDTLVAVVDTSGLVTGVAPGVAEVTATSSGVSGTTALTVAAAVATTVAVTPDTVAFTALGQSEQLAAEVRDQIGRVMEDAAVAWSSGDTAVAVVDAGGVVTAGGGGIVTITAVAGEASGAGVVTVMQVAGSVVVSPAADTISMGDTLALAAEAFDANGYLVDGAEFSWSSSDEAVAEVGGGGVVRGVREGTVTITATAGDAHGTSEITVENPDRAALVALYNATDGPNWGNNENWLTAAPLSEWHGITTDRDGRVVQITLFRNQLSGPIPPELGRLANLTHLDLSFNRLTGPIPPELGGLVNLTSLGLGDNLLTGSFPLSFLELTQLEEMGCARTEGACLPATTEFREWVRTIEARNAGDFPVDAPWCDEIDKAALKALFEATGGSSWTRSDGWLAAEDLGQWYGVQSDSIGRVGSLDLTDNRLSGRLPVALGQLTGLTELRIGDNALTGRLPLSLVNLPLEEFAYDGTSLCVSDDGGLLAWLDGIPNHVGTGMQCPRLTDREILELLYLNTDGPNWRESGGWLTDAPLTEWWGVRTDDAGRVVSLHLGNNGISGSIPAELAQLSHLTGLYLSGNGLSGPIPPELGDLNRLTILTLGSNQLSGSIPPELGRLSQLTQLSLSWNKLSGSIPPELAELKELQRLELNGNFLTGSLPPELGQLSQLTTLWAWSNRLSGSIPPELGTLHHLTWLGLSGNRLKGEIPDELAKLGALERVELADNSLSGRIPSWFGRFDGLWHLDLSNNELAGAMPAELGTLARLAQLDLGDNELAGPLPADLGRAASLRHLDLRYNALAGPVPPEFASLELLASLILTGNPELAGPLPAGMTALNRLDRLQAGGTGLCFTAGPPFDAWYGAIADRYLARCREGAVVYLTQAVQSWIHPVALVAGEAALLRVFPTAPQGSGATMPAVRATFHADGVETYSVVVPASGHAIPDSVDEADLAGSANAEIPGEIIAPGLEMVIHVDPDSTLDPELGVTSRIPDSGRLALDVRAVPTFRLTLIPFLWEGDADSSVAETVDSLEADPEGHELLRDVRTLLPVAGLDVAGHDPVYGSHQSPYRLLAQVVATRLMEGGAGHWMGLFTNRPGGSSRAWPGGVAQLPGYSSVARVDAYILAHELGHNLGLRHAPCGGAGGPDPLFPSSGGRIADWGYDFEKRRLVRPQVPDVMSYCRADYWIGGYHFDKALRHRLADADAAAAAAAEVGSHPTRSLLLWGGRDTVGVPYLDPAFVVDATLSLPPAGTEYTVEGTDANGTPLFSYSFDMPMTGDAEGEEATFVFTLPAQDAWADDLATITLSGPGGSVTLDGDSDLSMAILRDPRTGQVRAFLSDLPTGTAAADAVGGVAAQGLEVLFSRGIPSAEAWRR